MVSGVTLALLTCGSARGAVSLVQHGAANSVAHVQSFTFTLKDPSTPGDFLVVVGGWSPLTYLPVTPTDNYGNTFRTAVVSAGDQLVAVYFAAGIDGGPSHAVTWSIDGGMGGTTPLSLEVAEFSGIDPNVPYLQIFHSAMSPNGTGTNLPDSGFVTPSAHGSLVFGAMAHDGQFLSDAGSGFTLLDVATDDAVNYNPAIDEFLIDENASPVAATFTLTGDAPWAAVVAVFQPAPISPPDAGGPADGGVARDAGASGDAGASPDAGVPGDAGGPGDAGRIDAGGFDSGTPGGVDSGAVGPRQQLDIGCGCNGGVLAPACALMALGWALRARRKC
jgi:hypothetical protein